VVVSDDALGFHQVRGQALCSSSSILSSRPRLV
jgi:hypothetical protein